MAQEPTNRQIVGGAIEYLMGLRDGNNAVILPKDIRSVLPMEAEQIRRAFRDAELPPNSTVRRLPGNRFIRRGRRVPPAPQVLNSMPAIDPEQAIVEEN